MSKGRINERGDLPNSNHPWRSHEIEAALHEGGLDSVQEAVGEELDEEPTKPTPYIPLEDPDSEWDNRPWSRGDRFDGYQDPHVGPFDDFLRP